MSLHTQLLRGLFVLPVLLLIAVAGVVAPARPQGAQAQAARAQAVAVAIGRQVAVAADTEDAE
ncbi:MAG: hypothetical protein ACTHKZ_05290 [Lysobacteraceae bacterium]